MPRPRKIWAKSGRNYYYTKIDGKVTRLGPLKKGEGHSQRLLERRLKGEVQPAGGGTGMTFARLADKFLDHSQATNEKQTYEAHRLFLQSFRDHVGNRIVSKLCEAGLDEGCRKHAACAGKVKAGGRKGGTRQGVVWSESTQARAKAIVLAALNYGARS